MARPTTVTSTTPVRSPNSRIQRILDIIAGTARDIGAAEGAVLALNDPLLPRLTGWFHPDLSQGFSATFPHIIQETLTVPETSNQAVVNDGTENGTAPRSTWSHLEIASEQETLGELWLYRGQRTRTLVPETGHWANPAVAMSRTLAHIARWDRHQMTAESLRLFHEFSRLLNATPELDAVCEVVAEGFKATFGSTGVAVELLRGERTLVTQATDGPIPIRDGVYVSRQDGVSPCGAPETQAAGDWLFDVFALCSGEALPLGAITCYWTDTADEPSVNLALAELMAEHSAAAIQRSLTTQRAVSLPWSAASALADAVDARDAHTRHHARRVARYSRELSERLELPRSEVDTIEVAGLLHDIGKIGVPDRVLQTPGSLEPDDWDLIRRHPEFGAAIAAGFADLRPVAPIIRHHHERYDGTGYPSGLKGPEIPIGARIIAVVEAFDTLIAGRPYQSPWNVERTLTTLENLGGTQFDAEVVSLFAGGIREGTIHVEIPALAATGDLDLHRWIGAEARAYGLLQRIGNEVGELIDIGRFLKRLKQIIEAEFPDSMVDVFIRDREHDQLIALPDGTRPHLEHDGVYIMKPDAGVVGWVARHGQTQNIPDVPSDPRYLAPDTQPMRSELAVPMMLDDECIGVINLECTQPSAFSRTDEKVLETIASYVARAIQVAQLHSQVKQQTDVDSMTGLLNHRAFYRTLEAEVNRAALSNDTLSVAIIDVDAFKSINDSKGHVWGDAVIRRLAGVLSASVRHGDAVARYGGDEFSIIMPGASRWIIERRMRVIEEAIGRESQQSPLPNISWGIATYPEDGLCPTELVAQADAAMYAVKQGPDNDE